MKASVKITLALVLSVFVSGCAGHYVFYQSGANPYLIPTGVYSDSRLPDVFIAIENAEYGTPPVGSPTQEAINLPTRTPEPCHLLASQLLNVRSEPSITARIVNRWAVGETKAIQSFWRANNYLWAQHAAGWSAVYDYTSNSWWVYKDISIKTCYNLSGWPDSLE